MADLAKTSRICVLFDTFLVAMIAYYSKFILSSQLPVYCRETFDFVLILPCLLLGPTSESIAQNEGLMHILSNSTFRPRTCFMGLGIISFAFSCQHSSLIIAGSLQNPTVTRWQKVTVAALCICSMLSIVMGAFG